MKAFAGRPRAGMCALWILAASAVTLLATGRPASAALLCLKPDGEFGACTPSQPATTTTTVAGPTRVPTPPHFAVHGAAPFPDSLSALCILAGVGIVACAFILTWRDS
jgi:hypothetical protein